MSRSETIPALIYATAEYREGYRSGLNAARRHRPETSPFLPQDPRHLGWADAVYDAWSARRMELSRAANRPADCHVDTASPQLV